ncbi:unnamed protein product [Cunninghamella blakesleeana]
METTIQPPYEKEKSIKGNHSHNKNSNINNNNNNNQQNNEKEGTEIQSDIATNNSTHIDFVTDNDHTLDNTNINNNNNTKQDYSHHRKSILNNLYSPINNQSTDNQTLRINKALDWQKKNRNHLVSKARQIALGELSSDEDDNNNDDDEVNIDSQSTNQSFSVQGTKRSRDEDEDEDDVNHRTFIEDRKLRCLDQPILKPKKKPYSKFANQVMYSENLEELPHDLLTDWVLMICPVGKRCLVTSGNGQTVARARSGRIINRFQSTLPNGSIARGKGASSNFCILDCIYDSTTFTFYVLDMMCWNGYAIYDCDTDFRQFWLMTKFNHQEDMLPKTNQNQFYQFKPLIPAPTKDLENILHDPTSYLTHYQSQQFHYPIDGLLFYHRKTQYITGTTPLVCWLPVDQFNTILSK